MTKRGIIDSWINNFDDFGIESAQHFNFKRQEVFNYFNKKYSSDKVKEIENLNLWEGKNHQSNVFTFESFKTKLKELGY